MANQKPMLDVAGAAVLYLERASEKIIDSNELAGALLGRPGPGLAGLGLWEALGIPRDPDTLLAKAIAAGTRQNLVPMLLHPAGAAELVAGGYLFPLAGPQRDACVLLLFQLAAADGPFLSAAISAADVIAVLGVDGLAGEDPAAAADTARHMIDIRFSLQQIVPARNDVGLPVHTTIPVALRNVTIEQAEDISRALLSHLAPLLTGRARIRIGLAQCTQGETALAALMAANNALLRLQHAAGGELIGLAQAADKSSAGIDSGAADGIFSDCSSSPQARAYLAGLTALTVDPLHGEDYLAAVVGLTLRQPDVAAVALYRRRYDDSYEYAAGGVATGEGPATATEKQLPKPVQQLARKQNSERLRGHDRIYAGKSATVICPLSLYERVLGYLVLQYQPGVIPQQAGFAPDIAAMHHLATELSALAAWRQAGDKPAQAPPVAPRPVDDRIDGYVGDNMEGAIDQAIFLSRVDVPVAVIGPRGTGKLYVAKVIHQETGGTPDTLVSIDCREFRSRKDALNRIARELERCKGKTLVFKSPHLMNPDAQLKLARQLGSRILADTSPPRYLPPARFVGLFPDSLEYLVRHGGLHERLASVFAAYPIRVPPIRDRKRAVLRWAHKILSQEAARRDRKVSGFTPDAEQAMLLHDWPGNISEMRQCIMSALDKTDKEWLTPVDLGIFKGLSPAGRPGLPEKRAFLQVVVDEPQEEPAYAPATIDELGVALGEALHSLLELDAIKPLGAWLDDEVILAACERFRDSARAAADFLHTRPRNISRWMPRILARDHERAASSLWQAPRRLVRQWIREAAPMDEAPQQLAQALLLSHIQRQCEAMSIAERAGIMGVSTPTYQKRLQEILDH